MHAHRVRRWISLRLIATLLIAGPGLSGFAWPAAPQGLSSFDRDQGRMMLGIVKADLVDYYYDPAYHGLNLDEVFGRAQEKIARANSHAEIYSAIAETLLALDDSHTVFAPPWWSAEIEYGWFIQMIGERCHLIQVRPDSDAETQGLKRGDLVLAVDGHRPSRERLDELMYDQRTLAPRASTELTLQPPGGAPRAVIVRAKVEKEKKVLTRADDPTYWRESADAAHLGRDRFHAAGDDLLIWKMQGFSMYRDPAQRLVSNTAKYRKVILDLRGNPGGSVEALEYMVGKFVGEKVRIGDEKSRKGTKPLVSRKVLTRYEGTLIVLVDSDSASAAEVFARVIQLNGRAKVIGDRTAGRVMTSLFYPRRLGSGVTVYFGSSITIADVIMPDGKSLEKVGVTPDEVMLPSGEDLASQRDPVLSYAASLCGVTMTPAEAGALFPFEWKR